MSEDILEHNEAFPTIGKALLRSGPLRSMSSSNSSGSWPGQRYSVSNNELILSLGVHTCMHHSRAHEIVHTSLLHIFFLANFEKNGCHVLKIA